MTTTATSCETPSIYVISRIHQLDELIGNLAPNVLGREISVKTVPVPETNDFLTDAAVSEAMNAEIAVIDPVLLEYNYMYMPSLKWAHCTWAGIENLFKTMDEKPRFKITRHGGERFCNLMAEYVMGNILSFERNFIGLWQHQAQKIWLSNFKDYARLRTLDELTITILGIGNMGQAVAKFFKERGSKLYGLARTNARKEAFNLFNKIECHLNKEVLGDTDYIVNTLPSTKDTAGLLGGNILSCCTKKPVFINVGRGDIINEADLITAYNNGWIGGAILDVFNKEPLPDNSPLWNLDRVFITPHCAALSQAEHIAENFLKSLVCHQLNIDLPNSIVWDAGY